VRRLVILALPVVLTGCAGSSPSEPFRPVEPIGEPAPMSTGGLFGPDDMAMPETIASGTFTEDGANAITYDPRIVPVGATAQVTTGRVATGITVRLAVTGMLPRRTYGAHLHTKPCTPHPSAAGPHYQHEQSPTPSGPTPAPSKQASAKPAPSTTAPAEPAPSTPAPSTAAGPDPAYANPENEVWLDFTADREGAATATAVQEWAFDELTPPRSVIVHMTRTRTEPGLAGTAGERVACLTLPG
jgi:superoxide dismutase, Cu-Zn family